MRRTSNAVIAGWPAVLLAVLLAPVLLPLGFIASRLSKPIHRSPAEVAGFIEDLIDGTGGEWDWDEFECVPIADPFLESIRCRAVPMGPPRRDVTGLRALISEIHERFPAAF